VSGPGPSDEVPRCLRRLERAVAATCDERAEWPRRIAAGINAILAFAEAEPNAARVLSDRAIARRHEGDPAFEAMVDRFATLLSRGAPVPVSRNPELRTLVTRIARQVNLQLEAGRPMLGIASDLTFLTLMPFLGFDEARRWSYTTAAA
jgi:hypothetical protein